MQYTRSMLPSLYKGLRSRLRQYQKGHIRPFMRRQLLKYFSGSDLIRHDILDRPHYAFSLLIAFTEAKRLGLTGMTAVELGVGEGGGLMSLCETAAILSREFDIACDIVGFDTGAGVPRPQGYRDHPEIWSEGQFMHDKDALAAQLPGNARILYGDVKETVPRFCSRLRKEKPIGFVSLDLDYYSSTKNGLGIFLSAAEYYLPAVLMYVDDIERLLTYNRYCGEMLAMREFNQENDHRKIERKPVRVDRKRKYWHRQIYCCHVLDHPIRQSATTPLGGRNEINLSHY